MDEYADFVFVEMEKAEKELKPCPFCGCPKVVILRDNEELYRYNLLRFRVVCEKCSAQIYRGYYQAPCRTVKNKNIENRERWEAERRKNENEADGNGGDG